MIIYDYKMLCTKISNGKYCASKQPCGSFPWLIKTSLLLRES